MRIPAALHLERRGWQIVARGSARRLLVETIQAKHDSRAASHGDNVPSTFILQ